jgi:hypothetical protein
VTAWTGPEDVLVVLAEYLVRWICDRVSGPYLMRLVFTRKINKEQTHYHLSPEDELLACQGKPCFCNSILSMSEIESS